MAEADNWLELSRFSSDRSPELTMWGLIMLLFMVAQLPGLIPHKLWASPP